VLLGAVGPAASWAQAPVARLSLEEDNAPPPLAAAPGCDEVLPIDLPTALRLVGAANPTVALARERVREAYARLRQAEVSWLPDLRAGFTYARHDGQIQRTEGDVITVSRGSIFVGGGPVLTLDTENVFFGPLIARRLTRAQEASARAVSDTVQLDVALAYLDLLQVHGLLAINAETLANAEEMLRNAEAAEEAKVGKTPADAPRARTEVNLRRVERRDLEARAAEVSARLAQLLLLRPTVDLRPADTAVVPVVLVPPACPLDELVAVGLRSRPELAESRELVEAALARWRQARVAPLFPRLEVSYSAGGFGGGRNDDISHFNGRGDGLAQAIWELDNLGAGNVARARASQSQYNQANLHVVEVQARVAAEVVAAAKTAAARQRSLDSAQEAVRQAAETWRRLRESAFGLGGRARRYDPLEPLLAEQALAQARARYLTEVIDFNRAQFQLYRALGQPPLCALPRASALPVEVPVLPATTPNRDTSPQPRPVPGTQP
jgi:outer membrane protein TolC